MFTVLGWLLAAFVVLAIGNGVFDLLHPIGKRRE